MASTGGLENEGGLRTRVESALQRAGLGVVASRSGLLVPCRSLEREAVVRVTFGREDCAFELATPLIAAAERRASAAQAVCDVNWQLEVGSFRLDPASGQISYRLNESYERSAEPRFGVEAVAFCVRVVERCWPSLLRQWESRARENVEFGATLRGHRFGAASNVAEPSGAGHEPGTHVWVQRLQTRVTAAVLVPGPQQTWTALPVLHGALVEDSPRDAETWLAAQNEELVVLLSTATRDAELEERIARLGVVRTRVEFLVERDLRAGVPAPELELTARSPAEYPESLLDRALSGVSTAGLGKLSAMSLRRPGAEWIIWEQHGRAVGVSLWVTLPEEAAAVVDFIGVLPEQRGRGLGRSIHAATLQTFASAGVETYRDATGSENVAMQRIFFEHGCTLTGRLVYFEPARK